MLYYQTALREIASLVHEPYNYRLEVEDVGADLTYLYEIARSFLRFTWLDAPLVAIARGGDGGDDRRGSGKGRQMEVRGSS